MKNINILLILIISILVLILLNLLRRDNYTNKKLKFCICLFGVISRSLKYTLDSIKTNILIPLKNNNIEYHIYGHNMIVDKIISERAGEINIKIDNNYKKLLNFYKLDETNQIEFDKTFNYKKYSKYGFTLKNENTFKNAIRQLYSLKMVNRLTNNKSYDFYIYIRPDLLYVNKINIKQILENYNKKNYLFSPNWHKWGGLNDRIYMGKKNVIDKISNRLDYVEEMTKKKKIAYHPEEHLKYVLEKFNFKVIDIDLKGKRVRSNGKIVNENFSQIHY